MGGFDEEIEYYHDESDVCVRLIQAGYKVAQLENAYVHHKMAPSFRRKNSKKTVVWDAIVKNTIYFGLLNTAGKRPLHQRLSKPFLAERQKLSFPYKLFRSGDFTFGEGVSRYFALCRALCVGIDVVFRVNESSCRAICMSRILSCAIRRYKTRNGETYCVGQPRFPASPNRRHSKVYWSSCQRVKQAWAYRICSITSTE